MKRKVFLSPFFLVVALSPAFFQTSYSCARGNTFLLSLELEVFGQDQIANFSTTTRSYAVTISSSTAILRVDTQDPASIATYRWFVDGTAIGPAFAIGTGGGEVTVNVPDGQSELYVNVQAPEGAFDSYIVDVDRVVPITVAMTNNVTNDIFILPYILEVLPTSPITASQPFTADLGGTVELTEEFLDFWQAIVPGGVANLVVEDFKATVQTRGGGATGPDVPLGLDDAALVPGPTSFCTFPTTTVCTVDGDCLVPPCLPPILVVDFPTSIDCAPAGLCDSLGKAQQCTDNGFCVTSNLLLPLDPVLGASYMAGDGVSPGQTEALFGWADDPPPVTAVGVPPIDGDGTWNMIPAAYGGGIAGELGMRVNVDGALFIALEGVMGVDSNGPDGVGVPDDASPTPDSALLSLPVLCPFVCGDGITDACEECDDGNNIDGDGCQADCTLIPPPCSGTRGSGLPDDPDLCKKTITVAAGDNVGLLTIFPYTLEVLPTSPIIADQPFTADLGGTVELTEFWLDAFQSTVPGGTLDVAIVDLKATVQTRGFGATGPDVALGWGSSVPFECEQTGTPCNPVNDEAGIPGMVGNTDCVPTGSFNPCLRFADLPTSSDCSVGGVCDTLGKNASQCLLNGFCVIGNLLLPLDPVLGASYMAGNGSPGQTDALFGWADTPPPVTAVGSPTIDGDGTWNMLMPTYTGVAGELGIATNGGGLFLAFEGVMGVDSNGPEGVGVPGDASPTPDSALLCIPVGGPFGVCGDVITDACEECDDGGFSPTCDDDCTTASCGDGLLNVSAGEECDDGGFSPTCDDDCTAASCGDGLLNVLAGEECDDGNNNNGDGCQADCTSAPSVPSCNFVKTGSDATPQTQTVNVACTWNVTNAQWPFPWELSVSVPTAIIGDSMFTADFDGRAAFPRFFLDILQSIVPGGVATMEIEDLAATVQIRSGATGPDVVLGIDPTAVVPGDVLTCTIPPGQVCTVDGDCLGGFGDCNVSVVLADLPTSTDCAVGGVCDLLGDPFQCANNGFCVLSEDLFLPLLEDSGTFTADASGEVLFGWADQGATGLTLCPAAAPACQDAFMPDGSYDLPAAIYANPTDPVGIRTYSAGLFLAYQCVMGEDGGTCASGEGCLFDGDCGTPPCTGVGVDDDIIMPTPDANLISCPIN